MIRANLFYRNLMYYNTVFHFIQLLHFTWELVASIDSGGAVSGRSGDSRLSRWQFSSSSSSTTSSCEISSSLSSSNVEAEAVAAEVAALPPFSSDGECGTVWGRWKQIFEHYTLSPSLSASFIGVQRVRKVLFDTKISKRMQENY